MNLSFYFSKKCSWKKRILAGTKSDGCYVILDDLADIKYAYSFGIEAKIPFDTYLANKDIDVYIYDHTINNLPYNNPKFHWQKIGICGKNNQTDKLKTLDILISENSDENIVNQRNMKLTINKTNTNTTNYNDISSKLKLLKIMTNNIILKYKGIENCLINDPEKEKCVCPFIFPKNVI